MAKDRISADFIARWGSIRLRCIVKNGGIGPNGMPTYLAVSAEVAAILGPVGPQIPPVETAARPLTTLRETNEDLDTDATTTTEIFGTNVLKLLPAKNRDRTSAIVPFSLEPLLTWCYPMECRWLQAKLAGSPDQPGVSRRR